MTTLYLTTDELTGCARLVSLSAILDFDHVVKIEPRVQPDLFRVETDPDNAPYAPDILDPDGDSTEIDMFPEWELITAGLTGQDRYNGPWLHDSELIEGGVAHRVLEHALETGGGFYVAVYAQYYCDECGGAGLVWGVDATEELNCPSECDPGANVIEGWAIAYRAVSK